MQWTQYTEDYPLCFGKHIAAKKKGGKQIVDFDAGAMYTLELTLSKKELRIDLLSPYSDVSAYAIVPAKPAFKAPGSLAILLKNLPAHISRMGKQLRHSNNLYAPNPSRIIQKVQKAFAAIEPGDLPVFDD